MCFAIKVEDTGSVILMLCCIDYVSATTIEKKEGQQIFRRPYGISLECRHIQGVKNSEMCYLIFAYNPIYIGCQITIDIFSC